MKCFWKWHRIFILSLLCFSMCAPLILVSYMLRTPAIKGPKDFVADLPSIKFKTDALKLNAIEEENAKGLHLPKQEVYKDQQYSALSYKSLKADQLDNDRIKIFSLGRKGTHNSFNKWTASSSNIHMNKALEKKKHVIAQHDQSSISAPTRIQNNHASQLHNQRDLDEKVKEMKDQQVRARAYLSFATTHGHIQLWKELKQRIKEIERVLGEVNKDADLTRSAILRMKNMEAALSKASRLYPDCSRMMKKLQSMTQDVDDHIQSQRDETIFLTQLVGRTTPKGLHCLSMRLTTEYFAQRIEERESINQLNLYNPNLLHYVVFSDNVLACAVVVNSTVSAAKEPEKIVFHLVTDSLNFRGISMWFLSNPHGKATIQVQSIDNFKSLLAKYGPTMVPNIPNDTFIDPRYSSPLNQLRFFLPELFPYLEKIIFLDHDVVVQKDLSALWSVDMKGKVNGAVQTCHQGEPQIDTLVNFSDPWVGENFDVNACTWAYGMNLFNLKEWRNQDLFSKYHRYLLMGSRRPSWKPKSLPLGWITFYNHTIPLDSSWLVLKLGHNDGVSQESIQQAAVIHYDGIMKPWSDIRINRYKGYWTKHVNFDHPYLQQCNIIDG